MICLTLQDASIIILILFLVDLIRLCVEYLVGAGETLLASSQSDEYIASICAITENLSLLWEDSNSNVSWLVSGEWIFLELIVLDEDCVDMCDH